jgi:DNA-binding transcriptional regulator YiaG
VLPKALFKHKNNPNRYKAFKSAVQSTFSSIFITDLRIVSKKSHKMHFSTLIESIKKRRETLQVTQDMLAALSGVGLRTLKQFESGKGNPTAETLQKLGDAIGLELIFTVKELESNQ